MVFSPFRPSPVMWKEWLFASRPVEAAPAFECPVVADPVFCHHGGEAHPAVHVVAGGGHFRLPVVFMPLCHVPPTVGFRESYPVSRRVAGDGKKRGKKFLARAESDELFGLFPDFQGVSASVYVPHVGVLS